LSPEYLTGLAEGVLAGEELTPAAALEVLTGVADVPSLLAATNRVTRARVGREVEFCAIVNARAGRCAEDCAFCAQSARHGGSGVHYPLLSPAAVLEAAEKAEAAGATRFSLVTAGRGPGRDLPGICAALERVATATGLAVCCSLGFLTPAEARALREAGASRYHHNLETAGSRFSRICSTHTYRDKIETINIARAAGLEICSGCIIGMGETAQEIVELAFALKEVAPASVPVNFLNPLPGTPLAGSRVPEPLALLKVLAVFRLVMPTVSIRLAGGRERNLGDLQALALWAGANGLMIGDYLTTPGRAAALDRRMVEDLGLTVRGDGHESGS